MEQKTHFHHTVIIEQLKQGLQYSHLLEPCILNRGIVQVDEEKMYSCFKLFEKIKKIIYFIPASGAASRMFAGLYERNPAAVQVFFAHIESYPFYERLKEAAHESQIDFEKMLQAQNLDQILYLLGDHQLGFLSNVKGLIPFHFNEKSELLTPLEEQILEVIEGATQEVFVHFTVPQNKLKIIHEFLNEKRKKLELLYPKKINLAYSIQDENTHVPMLDIENQSAVYTVDGEIVLRPGGHGALLKNLNELDADIVYIKNIDNVVAYPYRSAMVHAKQIILGTLFDVMEKTHHFLGILADHLAKNNQIGQDLLAKLIDFMRLFVHPSFVFPKELDFYYHFLNRPIRVCGMVQQQGEKGGGPFWVKDAKGNVSLQIVETAQVDLTDPAQAEIFQNSVYFNPVHIAASVKDFKGVPFDLPQYADLETAFISTKSIQGKNVRIYEYPGLWNGCMSNWLTLFVEISSDSFNPVKMVNDLLKDKHQVKKIK